jgi:hypothetical protein
VTRQPSAWATSEWVRPRPPYVIAPQTEIHFPRSQSVSPLSCPNRKRICDEPTPNPVCGRLPQTSPHSAHPTPDPWDGATIFQSDAIPVWEPGPNRRPSRRGSVGTPKRKSQGAEAQLSSTLIIRPCQNYDRRVSPDGGRRFEGKSSPVAFENRR